jgi:hypothetical protein
MPGVTRASSRQALLALAQRQRAEVLPVQLQQVEGLQDSLAYFAATVERVEDGHTIDAADHGLAIMTWLVALGPIITVAGEQTHPNLRRAR